MAFEKKISLATAPAAPGKKALTRIFSTKFAGTYIPIHGVAAKLKTGKTTLPVAIRITAGTEYIAAPQIPQTQNLLLLSMLLKASKYIALNYHACFKKPFQKVACKKNHTAISGSISAESAKR